MTPPSLEESKLVFVFVFQVEEAVVETVEEEYVPHIQPPVQPLSWAEVCRSEQVKWSFIIFPSLSTSGTVPLITSPILGP